MNKRALTLIISGFAILLLILTNPSEADHKAAVKTKMIIFMQQTLKDVNKDSDNSLIDGMGAVLGGYAVDGFINTAVSRTNYLLFSTTRIVYQGEPKVIGVGILGNVFTKTDLDEEIKNRSLMDSKL